MLAYLLEQKTSRGFSRLVIAAISNPGGSSVGRSFRLCTARSTRPSASASSISLVNMPLVPTLARATSVILSPVVLMISISTSWPCAAQQVGDVVGLPERELRSAGTDAQAGHQFRSVSAAGFRCASLALLQIEQTAHQVDHGGRFRLARRRLQRADRRMHDLVDDAARERFDRQFLLGRHGPRRPRTRSISAWRMVSR